jgi:hypothetical protein
VTAQTDVLTKNETVGNKMKTLLLTAVTMFLLLGCGRGTSVPEAQDAAFLSATQDFDNASAPYGIPAVTGNIQIQFGGLPDFGTAEAGYCYPATAVSEAHIAIDAAQWQQLSPSEQETLIFHELGHCVLHEVHRADSIMNPTLLPGDEFWSDKAKYEGELFKEAK